MSSRSIKKKEMFQLQIGGFINLSCPVLIFGTAVYVLATWERSCMTSNPDHGQATRNAGGPFSWQRSAELSNERIIIPVYVNASLWMRQPIADNQS